MPDPDPQAARELLPLVYAELREIARRRMAGESPGVTLDATALVHEAYLKMVGGDEARNWNGRNHFLAAAAEAMRRILVDRARARGTIKRGGPRRRLQLDVADLAAEEVSEDVLLLDDALERLAREAPEKAELVKLKFFGGLTLEEAAAALGIGATTADRHWAYARAWLISAIERQRQA